jgi:hypothetical protein
MKKLLFLLILPVASMAQHIDTAYRALSYPTCQVNQFMNNPRVDSVPVDRIQLNRVILEFNGSNVITINYTFYTAVNSPIYSGVCTLTGVDFQSALTALRAGTAPVFTLMGTKLGITYK